MAVAERESLSVAQSAFAAALLDFLRTIFAITAVRRVDTSRDMLPMHWWVFIDSDTDEILDQIHRAERRLRRAVGHRIMKLRIIPLGDVDMSALPEADTLFDR
jgi:hypothetical protein